MSNKWQNGYRSLTLDEIAVLGSNGCTADDWGSISVADGFMPEHVRNVVFGGEVCLGLFDKMIDVGDGLMRHSGIRNAVLYDVTVADNCLIENIGCHISRYDIGEECYIANVGRMTTAEGATYGEGNTVAVLNEAGDGNVVIYDGLTSQMAAFMIMHAAADRELWDSMAAMVRREVAVRQPERGQTGNRVKITNTREIANTVIGDECEISGASRLCDCTLAGTASEPVYIGSDVICENSVVAAGASVVDGAKVDNCFVGEACHIGRGFSAESSLFFANSYMDNGEACAAFCGPFTVSHHKSSLLIGGMYSFYNAGSGTNFSNHAYKLGPVHYGTLGRGSKTASGAHLIMPATIGAFSVLMGKVSGHPDTSDLPFSYVIGAGEVTYLVPGRNIITVGTWRDTAKWPQRDRRPRHGRQSLISFDWLSPFTVMAAMRGKRVLESLREEQGCDASEYIYGGCVIRDRWLLQGIRYYDMAIRLYIGETVGSHYCELPESSIGTGGWTDLGGLLVPDTELEQLSDDVRSGAIGSIEAVEARFRDIYAGYESYKWNWTYRIILDYFSLDTLTETDMQRITGEYEAARRDRLNAIRRDAEREFALGDVDEGLLADFLGKLEQ